MNIIYKAIRVTGRAVLLFGISNMVIASAENLSPNFNQADRLFLENCVRCHNDITFFGKTQLKNIPSSIIYNTITSGVMYPMAKHLSDSERQQIADHVGNPTSSSPAPLLCEKNDEWFDYSQPPRINGYGMTNLENRRFIPKGISGLSTEDIQKLTLEWAFAYPNTNKARSQPAIAGGALFVGSGDGAVYALDTEKGCVRWVFKAPREVRTAITIDDWTNTTRRHPDKAPSVYFGDRSGKAYAVNAVTGELRWKTTIDDHYSARITGSIAKHGDTLYIPIGGSSGDSLEASCCTFRGSVSAVNAKTGAIIWTTYAIPTEPTEQYKNAAGVPQYGPSGAGVWNTPTIDVKRQRLYVGTGENSTAPAQNGGAIIAMDLKDGKFAWVMQASPGEAYNYACVNQVPIGNMNCPKEFKGRTGLDFGNSMLLQNTKGDDDVVVATQKTGWVFGLDPDNGKVLWRRAISRGDYNWNNIFGMATDGTNVFVAVTEAHANPLKAPYLGVEELGIHALNGFTGEWLWSAPVSQDCKEEYCRGYASALTATSGAVFSGSNDGYVRAHDTSNGELLWDFNIAQEFTTLNGNIATGSAIRGLGPVMIEGDMFLNAGNVLLKFSVDGD
jgi:polyvinyl alcohol dehydrogenase (cytochrome)